MHAMDRWYLENAGSQLTSLTNNLSVSFYPMIPEPWESESDTHVSFRAELSTVSYSVSIAQSRSFGRLWGLVCRCGSLGRGLWGLKLNLASNFHSPCFLIYKDVENSNHRPHTRACNNATIAPRLLETLHQHTPILPWLLSLFLSGILSQNGDIAPSWWSLWSEL